MDYLTILSINSKFSEVQSQKMYILLSTHVLTTFCVVI